MMVNRTIAENDPAHPAANNHLISVGGRDVQRVFFSGSPLSEKARDEMIAGCVSSPVEICGFVTKRHEIHYVANIHEFPSENFFMDDVEGREVIRHIYEYKKDEIMGIFHTHPTGIPWPSPRDIVGWPNPALGWRYFVVIPRDVIEWSIRL